MILYIKNDISIETIKFFFNYVRMSEYILN